MIVGNERAFLEWFYQGYAVVNRAAFGPATVDEYLRTYSGRDGVLGALGIYRAAFTSIAQTEALMSAKVQTPIVAVGGEKGLEPRSPRWSDGSPRTSRRNSSQIADISFPRSGPT